MSGNVGQDMWRRFEEARFCFYCGVMFCDDTGKPSAKTRDHLIPRSLLQEPRENNIVAACSWCNNLKKNMPKEGFRLHLRALNPDWPGRFFAEQDLPSDVEWFSPVGEDWWECRLRFDQRRKALRIARIAKTR